jgi:competence protein ComEA
MFKKILAFFAAMAVFAAFAAVDVNKATEAELDGVKGIGPVTSKAIMAERKKGDFKSWEDFVGRVKGVGDTNAAKFSSEGLTVGGASFKGAAAKATPAAAKKEEKAAMKTDAKAAAPATAAAPAAAAAKDDKKDAKAKADADKMAKTEAKKEKAAAKADDAKPAASAPKK